MEFLCHINFDLIGAEIGLFDCGLLYNHPRAIGELGFLFNRRGRRVRRGREGKDSQLPIPNFQFTLDFFAHYYYPRLSFAG